MDLSSLYSMLQILLLLLFFTRIIWLFHILDAKPFVSLSTFLFSSPFVRVHTLSISRRVPIILQVGMPRCFSLWWDFYCSAGFRKFTRSLENRFFYFSFIRSFLVLPHTCNFSFLILTWSDSLIPLVICLFPLFLMSMAHFLIPKPILISWQ